MKDDIKAIIAVIIVSIALFFFLPCDQPVRPLSHNTVPVCEIYGAKGFCIKWKQ